MRLDLYIADVASISEFIFQIYPKRGAAATTSAQFRPTIFKNVGPIVSTVKKKRMMSSGTR